MKLLVLKGSVLLREGQLIDFEKLHGTPVQQVVVRDINGAAWIATRLPNNPDRYTIIIDDYPVCLFELVKGKFE